MKISQKVQLSSLESSNTNPNEINAKASSVNLIVQGELNKSEIFELLKQDKPIKLEIGVDEAGRGPLLGSVMVGAVILPPEYTENVSDLSQTDLSNTPLSQLNDSKKISEKKRNTLYEVLPSVALGFVSVEIPAQIIDDINILQASLQGMRVAVNTLLENISNVCRNNLKDEQLSQSSFSMLSISLLFDGNKLPILDFDSYQKWGYNTNKLNVSAEVKGDGRFASIAAASVVAKVERDKKMYMMASHYPRYGIEKHKGYPTKAHFEALEKFGILPEHRRSFAPVKRLVDLAQ